MKRAAAAVLVLVAALAVFVLVRAEEPQAEPAEEGRDIDADSTGCLTCHKGTEEMHPWFPISCVGCHGGNGAATRKELAHVRPREAVPVDERVLPLGFDPDWLRFQNPGNLRVVQQTCGECHRTECADLFKSLHATTAGHLCDGLYENGVTSSKTPQHGIFDVKDEDGDTGRHGLTSLTRVPAFQAAGAPGKIATHYRDVPRKACMQCHLWGRGRAVRGRLGMDGDYRSEGCAACHVTYADDGLTESGDPMIPRYEPGHPLKHQLTSAIPTSTCVKCHYGDASIGLHFRGMAQLAPGMPGGPQVPGTTPMRLNGAWYIRDDRVTPPDIHHARGMHCIDCHTARDVMGDGNLYGQMEHAVEIECTTCHGTIDAVADFRTERGFVLDHLRREDDGRVILTSRVDGQEHTVKQAKDVVTKGSRHYNAKAAAAMTAHHGRLECYTCHNGWNTNFFGFHFDRNESFTQLDLLSGTRTAGRVTTLEKVFATFREFRLGVSPEGTIAPYMVGFSTMCTTRDGKGKVVIDQGLPRTAAGLSGMTMIHHQTHTTRPEARSCVECHRSATTWGMGSPNFGLMRNLVFVTTASGLEIAAFDRTNPDRTRPLATIPVREPRGVALEQDPVEGFATSAWVSSADQGVVRIDLSNPAFPRAGGRIDAATPWAVKAAGKRLYVCEGKNGVAIHDISKPDRPKLLGRVPTRDARDISLNGPVAYIADGEGGLLAVEVSDPAAPKILGRTSGARGGETAAAGLAVRVITVFQYSRPDPAKNGRTRARLLAFLADDVYGVRIVDATEPADMKLIRGFENMLRPWREAHVRGIAFSSQFDLGSEGGRIPSEENDYLYGTLDYVTEDGNRMGTFWAMKVTDPERAALVSSVQVRDFNAAVGIVHAYNPPFLQHFALIATDQGLIVADVSKPAAPVIVAGIPGGRGTGGLALEAFPLDRMIDEDGTQLKDISHEGARYLNRDEIRKILEVPLK
ncbi:MAG: hypothetical protein HUU15_07945 [Candidatus Brocadiae bacterium]|nr:hypothetical protein [Candidatus Brocadiia bacterium]